MRSRINEKQDNWDELLPLATLSLNTAVQSTTGRTPFELVYGRTARLPHESAFPWPEDPRLSFKDSAERVEKWREDVRVTVQRLQASSKERYDQKRVDGPDYSPGQLVLVRRNVRKLGKTHKLLPKFIGPFQVVLQICPTTYLVEDVPANRKKKTWRRFRAHIAQMKPYRTRVETEWRPEDAPEGSVDALPSPSLESAPKKGKKPDKKGNGPPCGFVTRSGRLSKPPARH